jgi:hypothetical protein
MMAADSLLRLAQALLFAHAGISADLLAHDRRDHLEGRGVADAGGEEQQHEHREEAPERARLVLAPRKYRDAGTAAIITTNTQKVTRPPPKRSEIQPVAERDRAPTSGPRNTNCSESTSGNWVLASSGKPGRVADERAEGAGIEPAHDPVVLALKITACSANEARAEAMSFMPNQAARRRSSDERHPDEAGVLQPQPARHPRCLRLAADHAEHAGGDHQRHDELHDADPEIAEAGIERQRVALLLLGKKKLMLAMDEAKLPPPKPHSSASTRKTR